MGMVITPPQQSIQFIDDGSAPEFFANGLQSVEVMGDVSRFVLFVERRKGGRIFRAPPFTFVIPNCAVAPAIGLTAKALGHTILAPVAGIMGGHPLRH